MPEICPFWFLLFCSGKASEGETSVQLNTHLVFTLVSLMSISFHFQGNIPKLVTTLLNFEVPWNKWCIHCLCQTLTYLCLAGIWFADAKFTISLWNKKILIILNYSCAQLWGFNVLMLETEYLLLKQQI